MFCIISHSTDPYFNLASEEYLLKECKQDIFLLYRNIPSIVVGKHQNTLAEINLSYVKENRIVVARRISGGGTVFHDPGNLNFAFITSGSEGEFVDYKKYTAPLIDAMKAMDLDVRLGERHELLLGDLKISGTASHVFRKRVLHHGTLLFSSRLDHLKACLKIQNDSFHDRAVKSIPSKVTNICDHLVDKMDIVGFQNRILRHILTSMGNASIYRYSDRDLDKIHQLRKSKFSSWEWIYGYSPKYEFNKRLRYHPGKVTIQMHIERGVIQKVNIEGDYMGEKEICDLETFLAGTIHDPETIRVRLSGIDVSKYIAGLENEDLLSGMF